MLLWITKHKVGLGENNMKFGTETITNLIGMIMLYSQKIVQPYPTKTSTTLPLIPNPANNFITIDSNLNSNYNLVSILGKTVGKGTLRQGDNTIDLSNFNKGVYFLNIHSNNNSKTLKIVKD